MSLIDFAERGRLPDFLIRLGIRSLLKKRLRKEDLGSVEANQEKLSGLMDTLSNGPVALVPEKANEQHYEVPARFFELALGKRKKYSSCFYPTGTESLNEAEAFALHATCQRAGIVDGMSILELGCGWGSLTLWMAENFPNCKIVAVSNSTSQREFILEQAQCQRIDRNLTVLTQDMNEFEPEPGQKFDRVVSVEMFEHMHNYPLLMKRIFSWLNETGKLFVHIFCHRTLAYQFKDESNNDWMSRYFFSGGNMPSDDLLIRFQGELKIERQWRWSGNHYHQTCEHWLKNTDRNRVEILNLFSETYGSEAEVWLQRWRIFFLACSELFRLNGGNEWYVSHYLFAKQPEFSRRPKPTNPLLS